MKIEDKIEKFLNEDEGTTELNVGDRVKIEKSYITIPIDGPEWKKKIDSLKGKVGKVTSISKHSMVNVNFNGDVIVLYKGHLEKV